VDQVDLAVEQTQETGAAVAVILVVAEHGMHLLMVAVAAHLIADNQDNSVGNTGNGQIIITVLCNALRVTVTDEEICLGETFTLTGTGEGEVTWDGGVVNGEEFEPVAVGVFTYVATSDDDGDCPYTIDIEAFCLA
jgi:hypothetical protein